MVVVAGVAAGAWLWQAQLTAHAVTKSMLAAAMDSRFEGHKRLETPHLDADALRLLQAYAWPGNVRELANVCERLAILHRGRTIGPAEVTAVLPDHAVAADDPELPLHQRLDGYERRLIEDALGAA